MAAAASLEEWFDQAVKSLGLVDPKHAYPDGPIGHVLNVARRNGTPHRPKHCACLACSNGFSHIAGVER